MVLFCKYTLQILPIIIIFLLLFKYIPPSCANTSKPSAGSRVLVLRLIIRFSAASPIVRLFSNAQACSLSTKLQVSTTLHYTSTVCCNRTAHSQLCLSASVEAQELNLNCTRATGKLNSGPFAPAAECVTTRPPRPIVITLVSVLPYT